MTAEWFVCPCRNVKFAPAEEWRYAPANVSHLSSLLAAALQPAHGGVPAVNAAAGRWTVDAAAVADRILQPVLEVVRHLQGRSQSVLPSSADMARLRTDLHVQHPALVASPPAPSVTGAARAMGFSVSFVTCTNCGTHCGARIAPVESPPETLHVAHPVLAAASDSDSDGSNDSVDAVPVFAVVNTLDMVLCPRRSAVLAPSPAYREEFGVVLDAEVGSGGEVPPEVVDAAEAMRAAAAEAVEAARDAAIERFVALETQRCAAKLAAIEDAVPTLHSVLVRASDVKQRAVDTVAAADTAAGSAVPVRVPSPDPGSSSDEGGPLAMPPPLSTRRMPSTASVSGSSYGENSTRASVASTDDESTYMPGDDDVFGAGLDAWAQSPVRGRRQIRATVVGVAPEDRGAHRFNTLASTYSEAVVWRRGDTQAEFDSPPSPHASVLDVVEEDGLLEDMLDGSGGGREDTVGGRSRSRAFLAPADVPRHRAHLQAAAARVSPYSQSLPRPIAAGPLLRPAAPVGVEAPRPRPPEPEQDKDLVASLMVQEFDARMAAREV